MTTEPVRCEVCGWPLAQSAEEGCVPGNCSMRPRPQVIRASTVYTESTSVEFQLNLAREEGAALRARVEALKAERDELRTIIRLARERLYDAHGRGAETTATVIRAVGQILRRADEEAPDGR